MAKVKSPYAQTAEKIAAELDIDLLALDKEWVGQPVAFFRAAVKAAVARERWDAAKGALAVTKADMDKEIRDDPTSFGLPKATDAIVANAIPNQPEFRAMDKLVRAAKLKVDIYQAGVDAFDQRKRALESIVRLHVMDYHSEPRAPRNEELEEEIRRPPGVKSRKD